MLKKNLFGKSLSMCRNVGRIIRAGALLALAVSPPLLAPR
jgi:hypothetical protein